MSGKLSFTGDTIKAMSLQRFQKNLIACYMLGKTPPVLPDDIVEALRSLGEMMA
jgi:hypothetical protein